ncbi:membrane protein [Rhizobium mesoamericanum]|uniref:membrane protein n=1 Tax=Rhizobium mesoamericanum TaxID=1079800 RepID=UPI0003F5D15C|nr:membrane protein [Rhizobium mesoamericanum]
MSTSEAEGNVMPIESSRSALAWGPILGGAVAATGITLILLLLGSGMGLTMVSPWSGESSSATTVGVSAAIWLIVVQWLSSALGGYLTGRLRTKWAAAHTDEIFFRDTAHGFIAWALATLFVAGFLASSLTSLATAGANAAGTIANTAGAVGAASVASKNPSDSSTAYFTDALLRPQQPSGQARQDDGAAAAEISRILLQSAANGRVSDGDKTYIASIVAARAGLPEADARNRVEAVLKQIDDAKTAAQARVDEARKAAATTALVGSLSLLVGAFISSAAAALGGRQRDEQEDLVVTSGRRPI